MRRRSLTALAVAAVFGAGLAVRALLLNFHLEGPPPEALLPGDIAAPTSHVLVPVHIPVDRAAARLLDALDDAPLVEDTTERLALNAIRGMLGLEVRTEVKCELTELQRAARDAKACIARLEKDWKLVGNTIACAGKFGFDSVDSIFRIGDACVDRHSPIKIPDRPTEIAYAVHLDSLRFSMAETQLTVIAGLRLVLDPPETLWTVFRKTKPPTCSARIRATAAVTPTLAVTDGTLGLDARIGAITLGDGGPCKGVSTAAADAVRKALDDALLKSLSIVFQGTLRDQLADTLDDPDTLGPAQALLLQAAHQLRQPLTVPLPAPSPGDLPLPIDAMTLALNPESLLVGQARGGTRGGGNVITLAAGLRAAPQVTLGAAPAAAPFNPSDTTPLPVVLRPHDDRFAVSPSGRIPLSDMQRIGDEVAAYIAREHLSRIRIDSLATRFYQAGERIVIGVDLAGVTWLRLAGSVYLTARPHFDPVSAEISLRDVKFDLDTQDFLLRRAAWVLETPIEQVLQDRLRFDLGPTYRLVLDRLRDHRQPIDAPGIGPIGTLRLALDDVALNALALDRAAMTVSVTASGRARLDLDGL